MSEHPATAALDPRLRVLLITPDDMDADTLIDRTEAALRGGIRAVQLRRKQGPGAGGRALFSLACSLRDLTRKHGALLFLNGRVDIALAVEADGVHCGARELPLCAVRDLFPEALLGYSAHAGEEVADTTEADFVTMSPVFASPGKAAHLGVEGLTAAMGNLPRSLPVLALGGVDEEHLPSLAGSGAAGVAVIRAIYEASDPKAAASRMVGFMQETWHA